MHGQALPQCLRAAAGEMRVRGGRVWGAGRWSVTGCWHRCCRCCCHHSSSSSCCCCFLWLTRGVCPSHAGLLLRARPQPAGGLVAGVDGWGPIPEEDAGRALALTSHTSPPDQDTALTPLPPTLPAPPQHIIPPGKGYHQVRPARRLQAIQHTRVLWMWMGKPVLLTPAGGAQPACSCSLHSAGSLHAGCEARRPNVLTLGGGAAACLGWAKTPSAIEGQEVWPAGQTSILMPAWPPGRPPSSPHGMPCGQPPARPPRRAYCDGPPAPPCARAAPPS